MNRTAGISIRWTYLAGPENPEGGFTDAQWAVILREAKAIVATAASKGIAVAGASGTGKPTLTGEHILLNGDASKGEEFETFYLVKTPSADDRRFHQQFLDTFGMKPNREVARGFCKTNGNPYEAVVTSILAVANRVGRGVFKATSDAGAVKRVFASRLAEGPDDACWEDYEALGMKEQDGRQVPNCVPTKTAAHRLDGVRGHQLLPSTLTRKLPAIYSQENVEDPLVQVKLFSPYTNAVWYLTEYDPSSNEAFGWADLGYGMGELGYISIPELEGLNRGGLPLVERDTSWRPVPLSKAKSGRTAASASKYPSVARQVEEDYRRKAITQGERGDLLKAIESAESRQDAERVVEQARKGRTAARYSRDPYWITAKYPGVDKKGRPFKPGERVFYYPLDKTFLAGADAQAAARDFEAHAFDEDFGSRGASSTRVAYEPPFHNAAKADEALGEAYRALIDLKLGFDSWEEIPQSAYPLYQQIMKAVDAVVTARQTTTQVRGMVAKKRY